MAQHGLSAVAVENRFGRGASEAARQGGCTEKVCEVVADVIPEWTHYGWFGFCPVKIADLDTDAPTLEARWWWLEWLFDMQEDIQGIAISLCSLVNPDYEPMWKIRVSREIEK